MFSITRYCLIYFHIYFVRRNITVAFNGRSRSAYTTFTVDNHVYKVKNLQFPSVHITSAKLYLCRYHYFDKLIIQMEWVPLLLSLLS
jgi:hypothetical protein